MFRHWISDLSIHWCPNVFLILQMNIGLVSKLLESESSLVIFFVFTFVILKRVLKEVNKTKSKTRILTQVFESHYNLCYIVVYHITSVIKIVLIIIVISCLCTILNETQIKICVLVFPSCLPPPSQSQYLYH